MTTKNTEPMFIGYSNSRLGTPGLKRSIDEMYVYDHVLMDGEIEERRKKEKRRKREVKEFILKALLVVLAHDMVAVDARCVITGAVVERRTLEPFAGIDILLDGKRVGVTNANGAFEVERLTDGDQLESAIIPDWGTCSAQVHCLSGAANDDRILAWPNAMAPWLRRTDSGGDA